MFYRRVKAGSMIRLEVTHTCGLHMNPSKFYGKAAVPKKLQVGKQEN